MSNDIEDFLRRVMERKQQQSQAGGAASTPAQPAPRVAPVVPREAAPARPAAPPPLGSGVAQHAARTTDTSDVTQHIGQLGAEVAQADDKLESRLHEVFDHSVGSLLRADVIEAQVVTDAAPQPVSLRDMLTSPQTLRQAIIVSEILRRPEHLWE